MDQLPQPAGSTLPNAAPATVGSLCVWGTQGPHGSLLPNCFPACWLPACTGAGAYYSLGVKPGISPC